MRILHLGLGSFHRAHQAVYLQQLRDAGDTRWSLTSANLRPDMATVESALRSQGGRYTLETVSPAGHYRYQQIQSIREVLPFEPSLASAIACGADPDTRIISFTVTEAGYYLAPQGGLDLSSPEVQADLARARCYAWHHPLRRSLRDPAGAPQGRRGSSDTAQLRQPAPQR